MTPATLISDIRDYPWTGLLAELLPAKLAARLPAQFQATNAPIVPSESIAGRALIVVIAIMSFLACLTAGAVYMINQSANAWVNDITSEITVGCLIAAGQHCEPNLRVLRLSHDS